MLTGKPLTTQSPNEPLENDEFIGKKGVRFIVFGRSLCRETVMRRLWPTWRVVVLTRALRTSPPATDEEADCTVEGVDVVSVETVVVPWRLVILTK
jgi:hypothetical protein